MNEIIYKYLENQTFNEEINKNLDIENDSLNLKGAIKLWGEVRSSLVINANHLANSTSSTVKIRAVVNDNAELIISGDIYIDQKADNCAADFDVKIIKLSDKSKVSVVPKLRIDNRKVKNAKHAVVIKKISTDDLYFLASRGISPKKGTEIITEGFLNI
jgi:Fe-S cluster assembly scaffold protein SufB